MKSPRGQGHKRSPMIEAIFTDFLRPFQSLFFCPFSYLEPQDHCLGQNGCQIRGQRLGIPPIRPPWVKVI